MSDDSALLARAARAGIKRWYHGAGGRGVVHTSERAARALLEALGVEDAAAPRGHGRAVRCIPTSRVLGARPGVGLWLNTYSLRGEGGLGIGSLREVGEIVDWAGALGCDFVGLSPLHLLRNIFPEISPYSPSSRLFRNPLYLDLRAIPEQSEPAARAALDRPELARERALLSAAERVDYTRSRRLQEQLVAPIHAAFEARRRHGSDDRTRAYARFVESGGEALRDLATFLALEDHLAAQGESRDWRRWPSELRDARGPGVAAFRETHAEKLSLHVFLQFELDRQLAALRARAERAGMRIGLYNDLAIGSHGSGFDAWAFADLFVPSVTLGAPPDDYADEGQDWGFAPLHPRRLVRQPEYFDRLVESCMGHMGALRIDHVMGLFRQFWIPEGSTGRDGAYVAFPATDLLDRLGAASERHGALVIGEDLGTVPRTLPPVLSRRNILSYRVLLFERTERGGFKGPGQYSSRALVTATTHDHPTFPGYLAERDLAIQRELGRIPDDSALLAARGRRRRDIEALRARLTRDGLAPGSERADAWVSAVYRMLARTKAPLLAVSLDDIVGELEPVNVPGETIERFPSWTRRMRASVADVVSDDTIAATLRDTIAERR